MGRSEELSRSVFMAKPGERGGSGCMIGSCAEAERRYDGLGATSESFSESGGSRLRRFPSFAPSSNLRASIRLWAANASNGERSGGISPATCKRGDGNGRANASLLALQQMQEEHLWTAKEAEGQLTAAVLWAISAKRRFAVLAKSQRFKPTAVTHLDFPITHRTTQHQRA